MWTGLKDLFCCGRAEPSWSAGTGGGGDWQDWQQSEVAAASQPASQPSTLEYSGLTDWPQDGHSAGQSFTNKTTSGLQGPGGRHQGDGGGGDVGPGDSPTCESVLLTQLY